MPRINLLLACASLLFPHPLQAARHAETIVAYSPGSGFATDFESGEGYTNAVAALREPSRTNPGPFGGPIDPFNPPYLKEQLVSLGAGGSLTVAFDAPLTNAPGHPFGLDFIIVGNAGFVITNGNFAGAGLTDGSLFSANPGHTRVSVSVDGTTFYALDSSLAPDVDTLFPPDSSGRFGLPVNPALSKSAFAGLGLDGIRKLYAGSAGGTGFDISWARAADGGMVTLSEVRFVRVDVLSGVAEIDGFTSVEDGEAAVLRVTEDFATDPMDRGWRTFGERGLFHWDGVEGNLEVTWDSSKPNSYFYRALGTSLKKSDDLTLSFDLKLSEIAVGVNTAKPFTFELAVGLIRLADATNNGFLRGTGNNSPNLLEFDYFPDSGFGATISPTIISSNHQFATSFTAPVELTIGEVFQVEMRYTATNQTLSTMVRRGGQIVAPIKDVVLKDFTDFKVDALSISSYSDEGAGGSLLAKGRIDNVSITFPSPPLVTVHASLVNGAMHAMFVGRPEWQFFLERTGDWQNWRTVSGPVVGTGIEQTMRDETPGADPAASFYRVRAERLE